MEAGRSNRGGKREGSGRKSKGNGVLYARMSKDAIATLKLKAEAERLTVGEYIEHHII